MKWVLIFLLLISAAFACGQEPSDLHAKDELAIRRVDGEWLKRFDALDVKGLDRMEADDFTVAREFGLVIRQQLLENGAIGRKNLKPSPAAPTTLQFRFYRMSLSLPRPTTRWTQAARSTFRAYRLDSSRWRLEGDSPAFRVSAVSVFSGVRFSVGYRPALSMVEGVAQEAWANLQGVTSVGCGRARPSKYPSHPSKFLILLPSPPELSILCKTISKPSRTVVHG